MKNKLLALITAAMSVVFMFSFTACNGSNETTDGSGTHTHTYSEQWSHNETEHWHACTGADCDDVTDKAAQTTEHTFSDEWKNDETHHWHKCENCDEIDGKAEHEYNADGVCVCGYETIPEETPPTTLEELMQKGNEKYQAIVVKTLNDHLLEDMLYKTVGRYDLKCVEVDQLGSR